MSAVLRDAKNGLGYAIDKALSFVGEHGFGGILGEPIRNASGASRTNRQTTNHSERRGPRCCGVLGLLFCRFSVLDPDPRFLPLSSHHFAWRNFKIRLKCLRLLPKLPRRLPRQPPRQLLRRPARHLQQMRVQVPTKGLLRLCVTLFHGLWESFVLTLVLDRILVLKRQTMSPRLKRTGN